MFVFRSPWPFGGSGPTDPEAEAQIQIFILTMFYPSAILYRYFLSKEDKIQAPGLRTEGPSYGPGGRRFPIIFHLRYSRL